MKCLDIVHDALKEILEGSGDPHLFFTRDYKQTVNGDEINFVQFCQHIAFLRKTTQKIDVTILSMAAEKNNVHSHHLIKAVKEDSISEFEVFARFQLREAKIAACYELTRQATGDVKDKNLGSQF